MTEHQNPETEIAVIGNLVSKLVNSVGMHLLDVCGGSLTLMLAVSNAVNHKVEMAYRTSMIHERETPEKEEGEQNDKAND